jgi:hypothetical protein
MDYITRKSILILIAITLSCIGLTATEADAADSLSASGPAWQFGLEGGLQIGHVLESKDITDRWGSFPGLNGGLWVSWQPLSWLKLNTGTQYVSQLASSKRYHPYPYVFTSDAILRTRALRVPFTLNAKCFGWMKMPQLYIGGGLYADIVLNASLEEKKQYLYTSVFSENDLMDDIPTLLHGWEARIGSSTGNSYLELRANFSTRPFKIEGFPSRPLRLVSYSLVYCLRLDNELFH